MSLLPSTVLTSTCGPRSGGVSVNPRCSSAGLGGRGLTGAEGRGSRHGLALVRVDVSYIVRGGLVLCGMTPNTKSTFSNWQTSG